MKSFVPFFLGLIIMLSALNVSAQTTWYTYQDGNWSTTDCWTTDPSGALFVNPGPSFPVAGDHIVILNSRTITMDMASVTYGNLTLNGTLDLNSATSIDFATISGSGTMKMSADNFPATANASNFVTAGLGEGMVIYEGGGYSINSDPTFYNVTFNLATTGSIVTLTNNITLNGSVNVSKGILQINDGTDDQLITVSITEDVLVGANGQITTGLGNPFNTAAYTIPGTLPATGNYHSINHQFIVNGNFTVNGSVSFTNQTEPEYDQFTDDGGVTLTFSSSQNSTFTINNTVKLYELVIDKGSDQTYVTTIYSDNSNYFTLFGPNNVSVDETGSYTAINPEVRKALWIKNGTLKLTGSITIPTLTEGNQPIGSGSEKGDYTIGGKAQLWMDSDNVTVYSTADSSDDIPGGSATGINTAGSYQALSVYGKLRVSRGFLGTRNSSGLVYWTGSNPTIQVGGGTLDISQFRSGAGGGSASYIQTGGDVYLKGDTEGGSVDSNPLFFLSNSTDAFIMSGGSMHINDNTADSNTLYLICDQGAYSVTGGTININVVDGTAVGLYSTPNLWNVSIANSSGSGNVTVSQSTALEVSNDIAIGAYSTYTQNSLALSVGGDFTVQANGVYNHTSQDISFIGGSDSYIYNYNAAALSFSNVNVSKDKLVGGFWDVFLGNTGVSYTDEAVELTGNLTLTRGVYNTYQYDTHIFGNVEIVDGNIEEDSGTPGHIVFVKSAAGAQTIKGASGKVQDFGVIELKQTASLAGIQLLSNIDASQFIFSSNGIVDMQSYNLSIESANYGSEIANFGPSRMFKVNGTISNGGLTLPINLNADYGAETLVQFFPIGTGLNFIPTEVYAANDFSADNKTGTVTIKNIIGIHPTTDPSKTTDALAYYWSVDYSGLTGIDNNDLKYTFVYNPTYDSNFKNGAVLADYSWSETGNIAQNPRVDIPFPFGYSYYGDFTFAKANGVFTGPRVLYSITDGNFMSASTWSEDGVLKHAGTATSDAPATFDYCIIGGNGSVNHTVTMGVEADVSQVYIKGESETGIDDADPPTLDVTIADPSVCDIPLLKGKGQIIYYGNTLINGDHTSLATNSEAIIEFNGGSYTLPSSLSSYPNLHVTTNGNSTIKYFADKDIYINGDLLIDDLGFSDFRIRTNEAADRQVEVAGNLYIGDEGQGTLEFMGGKQWEFSIGGDIDFTQSAGTPDANRRIITENSGQERYNHIYLEGNLYQGTGTIDLFDSTDEVNAIIEFIGDNSVVYSRTGGSAEFYRVIANKTTGASISLNSIFTLSGATDGANKALTLTSGDCIINNGGTITLSSGGSDFSIPSGSTLSVVGSTVQVSGSSTGIWLDGTLSISSSGIVNCDLGTNNYIEYSSSGNSEITISSGSLNVGSQIRRSIYTETGVLDYSQTGGTVTVGSDGSVPVTNRGVFEVLNIGSNFTLGASAIMNIQGYQAGASIAALYLNPETSSIGAGSSIVLDYVDTDLTASINLYSTADLSNITIGDYTSVGISIVDLTLLEGLTINSGGELVTNGRALSIGGDISITGAFTHGNNTTTLNGASAQTITGAVEFYDLVKSGSSNLVLHSSGANLDIDNDFTIGTGCVLVDNNNTVQVQGDVVFNGSYTYGGSGSGLILNSTIDQQEITSIGSFGRLEVNNADGVIINSGSTISIVDELALTEGVLDINGTLLTLGVDCILSGTFDANSMIQDNQSITDKGVKKVFPSGSGSFVFPVGSTSKYAPVTITYSANGNSTGSIRVVPINQVHASIIDDAETLYSITDSDVSLQYYWHLEASGIENFTGTGKFEYFSGDLPAPPTNYDNTEYISAVLNGATWTKTSGVDLIDEDLDFVFSGTNDAGITGDYTAGIEKDADNTSIPDEVASYITTGAGTGYWSDTDDWDTYPTSGGTVPGGGPRGSIVYIAHPLIVGTNGLSCYQTHINSGGDLTLGTTTGHLLGEVSGTGILSSENLFPAGTYTAFTDAGGGTIEYANTSTKSIMGAPFNTEVNNLKLSGSGLKNLDHNIVLNGDLVIEEGTLTMTAVNKTISIAGDIEIGSLGAFDQNAMTPTIIFDGSLGQQIRGISGDEGTFTGTSSLNNVTLDNSNGIEIVCNVDIDGTLTLTDGIVDTHQGGILTMGTSGVISGVTSSRYIDGALSKDMGSGSDYTFQVGNDGRYGPIVVSSVSTTGQTWTAEYFNNNPNLDGYDPTSILAPINFVSRNEYWNISASGSNNAKVTVRWDALSGVSADAGERQNLRLVEWTNVATEDWESLSTVSEITDGGQSSGTIITTSLVDFNEFGGGNYFTIGSELVPSTNTWEGDDGSFPADWNVAANWSGGIVPSAGNDALIPTDPASAPDVFPVLGANGFCLNLTIENGASVTVNGSNRLTIGDVLDINSGAQLVIEPLGQVTVSGETTNDATTGILINSDATGIGTFIDNGTINGTGDERISFYVSANQYFYTGFPIEGASSGDFSFSDGVNTRCQIFNNTTKAYSYISDDVTVLGNAGAGLAEMNGYAIAFTSATSHDIDGSFYTGAQSTSLTTGWNLVSNPYPSSIDWEASSGWGRTDIGGTIWMRTTKDASRVWATYNKDADPGAKSVNGGSNIIPPMQAFFVEASAAATLSVTNEVRTHTSELLKVAPLYDNVLRMNLINGVKVDEALVYISDRASSDIDQLDSEKRMEAISSSPQLYTAMSDKKLAINGIERSFYRKYIPLSYECSTEGEMSLQFTTAGDFSNDFSVYLKDEVTNSFVDLKQQSEYVFISDPKVMETRFALVFYRNASTGLGMSKYEKIAIYDEHSTVCIKLLDDLLPHDAKILVTDVIGTVIYSGPATDLTTNITVPMLNAVYLVKVIKDDIVITDKVFVGHAN